jgi:hypothetical protein
MTAALQAIKIWRGMREPANQKELSCRATVFFKTSLSFRAKRGNSYKLGTATSQPASC